MKAPVMDWLTCVYFKSMREGRMFMTSKEACCKTVCSRINKAEEGMKSYCFSCIIVFLPHLRIANASNPYR